MNEYPRAFSVAKSNGDEWLIVATDEKAAAQIVVSLLARRHRVDPNSLDVPLTIRPLHDGHVTSILRPGGKKHK